MKILILALSGIGDALMFTPAASLIKKHFQGCELDALVMFKGVRDIYERLPYIDNVYHFDFLSRGSQASLKFLLKLRYNYDATINVYPSNRREYNLINFLIGAKKRAAVEYLRKDKQNLGWLSNVRVTEDDNKHNVITNIKLCEKLLGKEFNEEPDLDFFLNSDDHKAAREFEAANNIQMSDFIAGIHPGCATLKNHIQRRWEPEKFAELSRRLIKENNAKVLIFGGPEEEELKKNVHKKIHSNDAIIVHTKNLAESAAIMQRCNLFVTNDSSLMHVASAMKVKTAAIIGPTNPEYIHPWKTKHIIISLNLECAPCFIYSPRPLICFREDVKFKCVKELTVDFAYNKILHFMNED